MALCRRVLNVWIPVSRQAVRVSRRWAATNGPRQLFHLRQCRMTFYSTLVPSDDSQYLDSIDSIHLLIEIGRQKLYLVILEQLRIPMELVNLALELAVEIIDFEAEVTVEYKHGFPVISIMLPSRKERCQFPVKPLLMNVGDLLKDLKNEDRGINSAAIFSEDGTRVSATTPISILLTKNFELVINETKYFVKPPTKDYMSSEHCVEMDNVKSLVHRLYIALHAENHQLHKQGQLLEKLENLKGELQNLEQIKSQLFLKAEAKSSQLMWVGLALMSTQAGALAWLTWWVYSWDIMEPVTYFITYGSSMGFYAYFLLTRQDCVYPDVKDRQFLHYFHRGAKRSSFDIEKYNKIKEELAEVETNLRRLRNPLQLKLPIEQLNGKD